jgi:DNA-binding NarL/FixJ family response regulator
VIRAGARGYVTKTISGRELADAVRRVRSDEAMFSPRLASFVLDVFSDLPGRHATRRPRVGPAHPPGARRPPAAGARLRPQGDRGELFISVKTVETHVSSVPRKTQPSNRYKLSQWASDRQLV